MSILIKGVKMPSGCFDCRFRDKTWDECKCPPTKGYSVLSCLEHNKRASFCPLVELPEKHGRLIDADVLIEDIRENSESYFADDFAREWIDRQSIIVEAEEAEGE